MNGLKKIIYTLADIFTLNKGIARSINGLSIRFPARWSRYFESSYEEPNVSFFRQHAKDGMTVIDIGAHIGVMSVSMARLSGPSSKIYSFEPTPSTLHVFKKVIELNHLKNQIVALPDAISDRKGTVRFYISTIEGNNSNTLIKYRDSAAAEQALDVNMTSIDEFKRERSLAKIDFIKIDAEGAELKVLNGAIQTFTKDRPVAILAMHPKAIAAAGDTAEQIWEVLTRLNYKAFFESQILDKMHFCSIKDLFDVHLIPQ